MATTKPIIGVVALGRPTFDVPYAEEILENAWTNLQGLQATVLGEKKLLFDAQAAESALHQLKKEPLDLLLILQVTFTDATMTVVLAKAIAAPLTLWSYPEPRIGGRLRLNALCGTNLAAHALGKAGIDFSYVHKHADDPRATQEILSIAKANMVIKKFKETKIGVIGEHPAGFDTCQFDTGQVNQLLGVSVEQQNLSQFLKAAATVAEEETDQVYRQVNQEVVNLAEMEQEPLRKSLQVYSALKQLSKDSGYQAMAIRCWPEFFTEYGCAACGPMSMMNEEKIPCGCEADLYGTLSTLLLQWVSDSPAFMSDLVDMNTEDNTSVFWHCGLAPSSMADSQKEKKATVHSNRKKPLLYEFTLKPGRVTIARFSQSQNKIRLVIGAGEMLRAPMSFTGTSGVIRFDQSTQTVLDTIMQHRLEHHYSLAYGEYRPTLRKIASLLDIPVVELT